MVDLIIRIGCVITTGFLTLNETNGLSEEFPELFQSMVEKWDAINE
jgi:hypothetical protein